MTNMDKLIAGPDPLRGERPIESTSAPPLHVFPQPARSYSKPSARPAAPQGKLMFIHSPNAVNLFCAFDRLIEEREKSRY